MKLTFIWGAGGVGKSHIALREACLSPGKSLLITLDPSRRLFELVGVPRSQKEAQIQLEEFSFKLKRTDELQLFESLDAKNKASSQVRIFYETMSKGLQEFRDYLNLIQLADELDRAEAQTIFVDTPPFQEALGLHRSIFKLKDFFGKSLVQLALRSAGSVLLRSTLKKLFEVTRIFVGKRAAETVFEFIEWLTLHTERFQRAARFLEELIISDSTRHLVILTPETRLSFFDDLIRIFQRTQQIHFVINRSVSSYPSLENWSEDPLTQEIEKLRQQEALLEKEISQRFPQAKTSKLPMILMGADTPEELIQFIRITS